MAFSAVETVSQLESRIISLARYQYNRGDRGGTFTPGFVRKETGQGYDAINFALSSLVGSGLLEKDRATTFRDGATVDIDIYRITEMGLQAFERIEAGRIKVEVGQPPRDFQEKHTYKGSFKKKSTQEHRYSPELHQSLKKLEVTLGAVSVNLAELHVKLDRMLVPVNSAPQKAAALKPAEEPKVGENEAVAQPKARKLKKPSSSFVQRNVLLIEAVRDLSKERKFLLAEDVKERYIQKCNQKGVAPKGAEQFSVLLNRFKADRLLSVKKMGCKAIGIEGRGSRLVIEMTPEGEEYLAKNATTSS